MASPTLLRLVPAHDDPIGGLLTQRAFPTGALPDLNPFLFLNHHGPQTYGPDNPAPFGPHPHKGFETLTFIEEGLLAHRDSTGGSHVSGPGGVQWMTAGSGIVHTEVARGIQAGRRPLPPVAALDEPARRPQGRGALPQPRTRRPGRGGGRRLELEVISGITEVGGQTVEGPVNSLTGLFTSRLKLTAGATFTFRMPPGRTLLAYPFPAASGVATPRWFSTPVFDRDSGNLILEALEDSTMLLCHGDPIAEPVVSYGPFVMNTEAEMYTAFAEFRAGKYGHVE